MKLYALFLLLLIVLIGCPAADDDTGDSRPPAISGAPGGTQTATATAKGFAGLPAAEYLSEHSEAGRPITVTVTLTDGYITDVVIVGPDETAGIGSKVIDAAPAKIKAKNSFDIDKVSGATYTSDAIKAAGQAAIAKILATP